jgi:Amt family ammonium transporter
MSFAFAPANAVKRLYRSSLEFEFGMKRILLMPRIIKGGALLICCSVTTLAQTVDERLAKIEQSSAAAQSAGDNAWMLVCAALVLLMTGPGLALFYSGLVRRKNVLATMMQSFILMAVVTLIWGLFGYSLAFADGNRFIGGFAYAFMRGVGGEPNATYAATIPHQTFMIYQLMFAVITPALITGAFAERMKFSAMLLFTALWTTFVYLPLAHLVWGNKGLLNASLGGAIPTLDFAGGTVVHISSGVSALVCAIYTGKRLGFPKQPMKPHNLTLAFIGACLLWVGWFGFNAGSALAASSLASSAFVATHFAAASATLGWLAVEWLRNGKPTVLGGISGAVAGLVAITPAAGFVTPMAAFVIGAVVGVVCYFMTTSVKRRFAYDDSLDVFGIHGTGGAVGALLTGVFATSAVNPVFGRSAAGKTLPVGLLDGNAMQLLHQLIGVLIAMAIAVIGSLVLLKIVDLILGVRVSAEDELQGLDISQHGEEGYEFGIEIIGVPSAFEIARREAQTAHAASQRAPKLTD